MDNFQYRKPEWQIWRLARYISAVDNQRLAQDKDITDIAIGLIQELRKDTMKLASREANRNCP